MDEDEPTARARAARLSRFDITTPHIARVYDHALGGKDNYAADRDFYAKLVSAVPEYPRIARDNRRFLLRAVKFLAESGIDQFIDLGTGIPTSPNVHETARDISPGTRVVYVDNDPIVAVHNDALLASDPDTACIEADIRDPEAVLAHPDLRKLIDFDRPVGVLMVAVLHVVADEEDPAGIVARFGEAVSPGSHLVISHAADDSGSVFETVDEAREVIADTDSFTAALRSHHEVEMMFAGFALLDPGLVPLNTWRPDIEGLPPTDLTVLAGVARKP